MGNPFLFVATDDGPEEDAETDSLAKRRRELAGLLRSYVNAEITRQEFIHSMVPFAYSHPDVIMFFSRDLPTSLGYLNVELWQLSPSHWETLKRAVILLESDFPIEVTTNTHWSRLQRIAAVALLAWCFAIVFCRGLQLLLFTVPISLVSMLLSRLAPGPSSAPCDDVLACFQLTELQRAYDADPLCQPSEATSVRLRASRFGPIRKALGRLIKYCCWLIFPSVPLTYQSLPTVVRRITVVNKPR